MPVVRAALHVQQNRRSALNSELGRWRLLNAQFLNRFGWKNGPRDANNPGLSNRGIAIVPIVVVEAVDEVIIRGGPGTVDADGKEAATLLPLNARRNRQQRVEVPPIDWNVLDLRVIHIVVVVWR